MLIITLLVVACGTCAITSKPIQQFRLRDGNGYLIFSTFQKTKENK